MISERSREIRKNVPLHLCDLDFAELGEYDVVLNEMLARPACARCYMAILREVRIACGSRNYVCESLGLEISWSELTREVIRRASERAGVFSIFDIIQEHMSSER